MPNLLLQVVESITGSGKKPSASFEEGNDLVSQQMENLLMINDVSLRLLETIDNFLDRHEYSQGGLVCANQLICDQLETDVVHSWVHWLCDWLILVIKVLNHLARIKVL